MARPAAAPRSAATASACGTKLSRIFASNPPFDPRAASVKPVTAHLSRALDLGERGYMQGNGPRVARNPRHADMGIRL